MTTHDQPRITIDDYPCLGDTTSLKRLKPLARQYPDHWRRLLVDCAPCPLPITPATTVQQLLGTAFDRRCLPGPTTSVSTLGKPRSYARRLRWLLPPALPILRITPTGLDRLERQFVERGEEPDAASRLVAHLRALAVDALAKYQGVAPLPVRRRRASSSIGASTASPADVAAVARGSSLEDRIALGLLLLERATIKGIVRIDWEEDLAGPCSLVKLAGIHRLVPPFLERDLLQLRGPTHQPGWVFPGRTAEGRMGERALSSRLKAAAEAQLDRPLRIADIKALGRRIWSSARGAPTGVDPGSLHTWEDFGRLVVPGCASRRAPVLSRSVELQGLRDRQAATERACAQNRSRTADLQQQAESDLRFVVARLKKAKRARAQLRKQLLGLEGLTRGRGDYLDRVSQELREIRERLDDDARMDAASAARSAAVVAVSPTVPQPPVQFSSSLVQPTNGAVRSGRSSGLQAGLRDLAEVLPLLIELLTTEPEALKEAFETLMGEPESDWAPPPVSANFDVPEWGPSEEIQPFDGYPGWDSWHGE